MRETKAFINLTHSSMNRCQFKARLYLGAYILSTSTRTVAKLVNTPRHTLAISVWSQLGIWIHHCWSKSWVFTPQRIIIYPPPPKKIVLFGSHTQNTARIIKKSQTKNIKRLQGVTVQNFISAMAKIQQFQKMNNKLFIMDVGDEHFCRDFNILLFAKDWQRAFWLHRLLFETTQNRFCGENEPHQTLSLCTEWFQSCLPLAKLVIKKQMTPFSSLHPVWCMV